MCGSRRQRPVVTESERVRLLRNHAKPWNLRREPNPQSSQRYRHWHLTYTPALDGENCPYEPVDMWFYIFDYAVEYMREEMAAQARVYANSVGVHG